MRLNLQTDFSLRLLMYLATKEGGTATIQEVSSRLGLSQTHMMRVAAKLVNSGLLTSNRGRLGGISLSKDASLISVEDVVKAVEPDFALVQCFDHSKAECSIEPVCALKGVLYSAMEAFFGELRQATIAQLTLPNRTELIHLFRMEDVREVRDASRADNRPSKSGTVGKQSLDLLTAIREHCGNLRKRKNYENTTT